MSLLESTSPSSHRSRSSPDLLPPVMTLQEAALRTGTSPEVLMQQVRAGRIPFTLVSGRSDDGNSVLLHTEDLVRGGMLEWQPAGPTSAGPRPTPAARRAIQPAARPGRPARLVWYGAAAAAAIVTALVAVVPSVKPTSGSKAPASQVSRSIDRSCQSQPNRKECRGPASSRSRAPSGSTVQSGPRSGSASVSPSRPSGASGAAFGAGPAPLYDARLRSPLPRQASPKPAPTVGPGGYPVPPRIPRDCSRDVTADLLAWIKTVPDNSTLSFPSRGCFRIDGTLKIAYRSGLTFAGNGTTLNGKFHTQGHAAHVHVYMSKGITFTDMTVKGANPHAGVGDNAFQRERQWEAAWEISGSEGVMLTSVRASDLFGDFVTIEPEWIRPKAYTSRNITVQNSHFERNGRQGISISGGEDVTIRNNYIGEVRHALLDLEPEWPTLPIDNVRFTGNRTGAVRLLWIANGGVCNAGVSNVYVANNVMEENAGIPLFLTLTPSGCAARGPFILEGNVLIARQSPHAAFDFIKVHDVTVRRNQVRFVRDPRTRFLVNLVQSNRVVVLGNTVTADPRDTVVFVKADPNSDFVLSGNRRI